MVAAFDGWVDAGSAATTALGILADEGAVVATFDADALFDYRARRPPLEIVDGRLTELTWPELVLRRTRLDERDMLVLVGPEPDYRWREFCADVNELVRAASASSSGSASGAIPAAVPHTRQVPILGTEAARASCAARSWPGRRVRCVCRRRSCRRSSSRSPPRDPGARLLRAGPALRVRAVRDRGTRVAQDAGTSPRDRDPGARAGRGARELRARLDTAAGLDDTTRGYVERLEAMYDEQRLPSGDDLISDIERFLRDQGVRGWRLAGRPAELGGSSTDRRQRQVCRLRRRPASRRRVDAPPVDGLDVRRSVRDDHTIDPGRATPDLLFVRNSAWTDVQSGSQRECEEAHHGRVRRCDDRSLRCVPQTQCEATL